MALSRRRLLAAPAAIAAAAQAQTRRPNVLIILSDDQGYGDFSCHGNPVLKTPALDRLHRESVRFTDFHVAPMCTPTRGQLMTGLDAMHNRATSVTAGRAVLQRGLFTMPEIFAANGYDTGIFGKWHLGDNYPYRPMDRGFQTAKYHLGWGLSAAPEFDNDYQNGRYRDQGVVKQFDGYCTDFWFREAMAWMKTRTRPFLCYLPTNAPHGPLWVSEKYSGPYKESAGRAAPFFGMIANLDENIARLESFLDEAGLRDNTIVIFMTDNGGTAGVPVYNAGMRGRKTQIYHGGHRVPCFVRWPGGGLRPPGDVDVPAQIQDVLPTLIDLCALRKPAKARFDGSSLAGQLRGEVRAADRMMVVQYGQIPQKWDSCVIWNQWRLIRGEELYDLKADPAETQNVAAANRPVVDHMRAHYEKWWAGIEPSLGDFQPVAVVGTRHENPVVLTSSDWQEIYADNHGHVSTAAGGPRGGPWNIEVGEAGRYEIALARWPFERGLALDAPNPAKKMAFGALPEGKALPVRAAKLAIGGKEMAAKAKPGGREVAFTLTLPQGKTKLQGWFQDEAGADLCGAFYARVRKL